MRTLLAIIILTILSSSPVASMDLPRFWEGSHATRGALKIAHTRPSASPGISCLRSETRALWQRLIERFGPMRVSSTCRPGAVIRGTGHPSLHRYGLAIDFMAPRGQKNTVVKWLIANHHSGGVMTYSNKGHIHVDIGRHFVRLGARG